MCKESGGMNVIKRLGFFVCVFCIIFSLNGCGSSEYSPEEGSVEAAVVERFSAEGFVVTNVEQADPNEESDIKSAVVSIKTDASDSAIEEYIMSYNWSAGMFDSCEGENDGTKYFVKTLIINDDEYTTDVFIIDNGTDKNGLKNTTVAYNLIKNGKIYIEGTNYDKYKKQQEAAEKKAAEEESRQAEKAQEDLKDKLIVDTDGKRVYKVHSTGVITFRGHYTGSGYFIVKVLDANQDFQDFVCNEIGDYVLEHKALNVGTGTKYIQIEWSNGEWELDWSGTGGN